MENKHNIEMTIEDLENDKHEQVTAQSTSNNKLPRSCKLLHRALVEVQWPSNPLST